MSCFRTTALPECVRLETRTSVVALNLAADLRLATVSMSDRDPNPN
jgi:hypothetical protein